MKGQRIKGQLFEVYDFRKVPEKERLAVLGLLERGPELMSVYQLGGRSVDLSIAEDSDFEETDQDINIFTDQGMVVFSPVTESSPVLQFFGSTIPHLMRECLLAV